MFKKWVINILISIDQLANALTGGDPDETISSRMGKRLDNCKACRFICKILNRLDWRNVDHCRNAIELDEGKDGL